VVNKKRIVIVSLAALLLIAAAAGGWRVWAWLSPQSCVAGPAGIRVCIASDMAKIGMHRQVIPEPSIFDAADHEIKLVGARNGFIGFQVLLRGKTKPNAITRVSLSALNGLEDQKISIEYIKRFAAHYTWVGNGGYTWGPPSAVLEWPLHYPDALIPMQPLCPGGAAPIDRVPASEFRDRLVWIDVYLPKHLSPGSYHGQLNVEIDDETLSLPVAIEVYAATLPDQNHIHAVGEIYGGYVLEGVGDDLSEPRWQKMAHCYQQLAHEHRVVFVERLGLVSPEQRTRKKWQPYLDTFSPILDGSLFTAEQGYFGPGEATPVSAWRLPWPQSVNGRVEEPVGGEQLARMRDFAQVFAEQIRNNGWDDTYFFVYIFDEVDGPTDEEEAGALGHQYIALTHAEMRAVQQAFDDGAGEPLFDLMWTSHSNPAKWVGIEDQDLTGIIRLWTPNAMAADIDFLRQRVAAGEQAWFYHAGHPYIGIHSINASGIEMRTWGVAAARYGLTGNFMWAVNRGDNRRPYDKPSYKPRDDRFGNGTLVYPGNMLIGIKLPPVPGPVPSMRLKTWRSGLQDFELVRLARLAGHAKQVDALLQQIMPEALSGASGKASWSDDPEDWHAFERRLLELASDANPKN
jgi:hypothetical protein